MLVVAPYPVGALLLLIAAVALSVGGALALFLPQLVIGGVFLIVALAIERWRYKPVGGERPDPRWTDTGERLVDPETGVLTAVYFDVDNGSGITPSRRDPPQVAETEQPISRPGPPLPPPREGLSDYGRPDRP